LNEAVEWSTQIIIHPSLEALFNRQSWKYDELWNDEAQFIESQKINVLGLNLRESIYFAYESALPVLSFIGKDHKCLRVDAHFTKWYSEAKVCLIHSKTEPIVFTTIKDTFYKPKQQGLLIELTHAAE
jgi:hypothetical protein